MLLNPIITKPLHRPLIPLSIGGILTIIVVYFTFIINHSQIHITPPVDNGHTNLGVTSQPKPTLITKDIIAAVNAERSQQGLASLTEDPRLDSSAAEKSIQISQVGWKLDPEANHINPDGSHGYTYAIRAASCAQASEDLSYGNNTSQIVVDAWAHSPTHLASMNGPWSTVGVGISGTVVTMHLCRY